MNNRLNVSSSPHVRSRITTGSVMYDVVLALLPATVFGVYRFGLHAFMILAVSVLSAVLTEFVFDYVCHRPNTLSDGSAVVTGLLLGLCLSPTVPLYIPFCGSLFAILVVKCFFGGLGQNFMNPALAGRCFLLISFGAAMTDFGVDGISGATPLAVLASGGAVNVWELFLGYTTGTIGVSCAALLLGGLYLLLTGGITWHIPVAFVASFAAVISLIGDAGFNLAYLAAQICGGGLLMGALFMATDPVTSPVTGRGQVIFGAVVGLLTALFRVHGSATDSVSYAIILGNILVPLIDRVSVPKPFGLGDNAKQPKPRIPRAAAILTAITLLAGLALGGVNTLTRDAIEQQALAANMASYASVVPAAESFGYDDAVSAKLSELDSPYGGGAFGKVAINEVVIGTDASGNMVGCAVNVTTADGFEGNITLSVGFDMEGTIQSIAFTELSETPGMGMRVDEDGFKAQFADRNVAAFTLNKSGGSTADSEIDSISGASTTSGAVVNAVNAAIDFYANYVQ